MPLNPPLPPLPDRMEPNRLLYGQTNFIKLAFVRLLQAAFSDESVPPEYRFRPEKSTPGVTSEQGQKQLWIYRADPNRETGLPAIFVESDPADASIAQLGQEVMREVYGTDPVTGIEDSLLARVYAGPLFIPVKITVVAKTTTDREILTDMVTGFVRFVFRAKFQENRIEYLDIKAGEGEVTGDTPADRRFLGTLTVHCQTQMSQTIDVRLYDIIQSINLDDLKYGSNKDDLTPIPG